MKQLTKGAALKSFFTLLFIAITTFTFAQTNVEVNGKDVESWFSQNWLWVVGGVVLLIILIGLFSGSSSRSKTIVTRTDAPGYTRTTTTETID